MLYKIWRRVPRGFRNRSQTLPVLYSSLPESASVFQPLFRWYSYRQTLETMSLCASLGSNAPAWLSTGEEPLRKGPGIPLYGRNTRDLYHHFLSVGLQFRPLGARAARRASRRPGALARKSDIGRAASEARKSDVLLAIVRMYRSGGRAKGSLASASGGGLPASQWRGDARQRGLLPRRPRLSRVRRRICPFLYSPKCTSIKKAKNMAEESLSGFVLGVSFVRLIPHSRNRIQRTRPPFAGRWRRRALPPLKANTIFQNNKVTYMGRLVPLCHWLL